MAWLFDGADDDVTLAPGAALALGAGDWTLAGWVRITSNAGAALQYVVSWNNALAANSLNWYFREASASNANRLVFTIRDGANRAVTVLSATTPGASTAWQHLVLRRSGAAITQYVDGAANGSGTDPAFGAIASTVALRFGGRHDGNPSCFYSGATAEWAKWDRALEVGEIAALAAGAAPANVPEGLAWRLPMLDYEERVAGLIVTNHGSTLIDPPPGIVALASHRVAQADVFVAQAAAAEVFVPGAVAACVFTPGIAAGQAHVY